MKKGLERFDGEANGKRVAAICFGITLFADRPVSSFYAGALKAFALYRKLVGDDALKVYATDTMRQHKPVSKRALTLLDTWLAPNAPARETIDIEYSDADPYDEAPRRRFAITGEEVAEAADTWPSVVRIALDPVWGTERNEEIMEFVLKLAELIPVRSGYAGFAFEYSKYHLEEGCEHAWQQSMRHPGIDIHSPRARERFATLKDSIRTIGWLTLLDDAFVSELGGRKALAKELPQSVEVCDIDGGVLLRAGERPALGDVNRNRTGCRIS